MSINVKDKKNDAISIINAALAILDKFPQLDKTNTNLSFNTSLNPFPLLVDLFKTTKGYDIIIDILSKFLTYELDALEIVIKGVLITNIKQYLSCSINPFISDELLLNGISFDVRRLDLMNILSYSPLGYTVNGNDLYSQILNNKGKYFYFGCEKFTIHEDLRRAKDFNAFLWYVVNKSYTREIWGQKEREDGSKYDPNGKQKKEDGIITIEYYDRYQSITNSIGSGKINLQYPINNCVQIFIGNVQPKNIVTINNILNNNIASLSNQIVSNNNEIEEKLQKRDESIEEEQTIIQKFNDGIITSEERDVKRDAIKTEILLLENQIEELKSENEEFNFQRDGFYKQIKSGTNNSSYRSLEDNYYYRKTLLEFNYDYVTSLKLFDAKVITAQLIDSLTNCISIDLGLSYEQLLIKEETKKLVNMIIETDDAVINDCFFSFSNDEYNSMLEKTELIHMGQYTNNNELIGDKKINIDNLLSNLNGISDGANLNEVQTIIEGCLRNISGEITNTNYLSTDQFNIGAQINFIENLLNNLAYVISSTIISPKVYLLLAINLKIMGHETNFNINEFINMFRNLLVSLIRSVRDELLKYLVNELMKIVSEIAKEVAIKITAEQAMYYARLIKRLIECFKKRKNDLDFTIDNVNYADIYEQETEPENNEC